MLTIALGVTAMDAAAARKLKTFTSQYSGALVFRDNQIRNGSADAGEPQTSTRDDGRFEVPKGKGRLYLTGGIEILSGQPNTRLLTLPKQGKAISTLTALWQALLDRGSKSGRNRKLLKLPANASIDKLAAVPIESTREGSKQQTLLKRDAEYAVLLAFAKSLSTARLGLRGLSSGAVHAAKVSRPEDSFIGALADALLGLGQRKVDMTDQATVKSLLGRIAAEFGASPGDGELDLVAQVVAEINRQIEGLTAPLQKLVRIAYNAVRVFEAGDAATLRNRYTGDGLAQQIRGEIYDPTPTPTPTPTATPTPTLTPTPTATPTPTPTPTPFIPALNDTGVTRCADGNSNTLPCPVDGHPGQDAEYGRDADITHNDDSDGHAGFSYTKIGDDGSALSAAANTWSCVQDQVTGLMWEAKRSDAGLHDGATRYSNYSPDYDPNSLRGTSTDATGFVNAVNDAGWCGATDWRLPTAEELASLVDSTVGSPGPTLDVTYFPNTATTAYWSSTAVAGIVQSAWSVRFDDASVVDATRDTAAAVRLVRGVTAPHTFTPSADGQEITDEQTGLIWRRCAEGLTWDGITSTCQGEVALFLTAQGALQRADDQATRSEVPWRLPNRNELNSIVDRSVCCPSIDAAAFPSTPATNFWTSTPVADDPGSAWSVVFEGGYLNRDGRSFTLPIRLVRGGR